MGESRTELICWINDLLSLGYTKIEQCGSGAAHVQILDSIYRDAPLSKVKFNAKHEYEYVVNFKVLQSLFDKHKIDNHIPVDRLIKCKFQDNLEFMQWLKKYWDQYYPGGQYDAIGRRSAGGGPLVAGMAAASPVASPAKSAASKIKKSVSSTSVAPSDSTSSINVSKKSAAPASPIKKMIAVAGGGWEKEKKAIMADYARITAGLNEQAMELKLTVEQVEKEREFYFSKLREIEIYIQNELEVNGADLSAKETSSLKDIQAIMYKTEDGFEVPQEGAAATATGMDEDIAAATEPAAVEMY